MCVLAHMCVLECDKGESPDGGWLCARECACVCVAVMATADRARRPMHVCRMFTLIGYTIIYAYMFVTHTQDFESPPPCMCFTILCVWCICELIHAESY